MERDPTLYMLSALANKGQHMNRSKQAGVFLQAHSRLCNLSAEDPYIDFNTPFARYIKLTKDKYVSRTAALLAYAPHPCGSRSGVLRGPPPEVQPHGLEAFSFDANCEQRIKCLVSQSSGFHAKVPLLPVRPGMHHGGRWAVCLLYYSSGKDCQQRAMRPPL